MLGLLVGAAVLGIIIVAMEKGEFPGWGKMILCALAASLPAFVINLFLPYNFFFVGLIVGALCAATTISATCGMSVQRSLIAALIYFGVQFCISFALIVLFR